MNQTQYLQTVRQVIVAFQPMLNRDFSDTDVEESMQLVEETIKIQSMMGPLADIPEPMEMAMSVIAVQLKDRPLMKEMMNVMGAEE